MASNHTWIDADGGSHNLSSDAVGVTVLFGRAGFGMAPLRLNEDEIPLQDGGRLRSLNFLPRTFDLPLLLKRDTAGALDTLRRNVLWWFNPKRGDGKLRVTTRLGDQREIVCRSVDGLGLVENKESYTYRTLKAIVSLRSHDPHWRAVNATTTTYTLAANPQTWFPIFPLRLGASTLFDNPMVNNTGDVETWPSWIITGPGDDPILRNLTSGEIIDLTGKSLGVGETIEIDTSPGVKTVKSGAGANLFGSMSSTSSLWALKVGNNSLSLELSGVTAASSIQLTYRLRYLGI